MVCLPSTFYQYWLSITAWSKVQRGYKKLPANHVDLSTQGVRRGLVVKNLLQHYDFTIVLFGQNSHPQKQFCQITLLP